MPVVTRGQTEAANALLSLRSSPVKQGRRESGGSRPSSGDSRPVREAARTARTLIRLSVEALNDE